MQAHVSVVGLDIAKSVFQVHAADAVGKLILRRKLKRAQVDHFFRTLEPCLVALEACPGSHFWARLLRNVGHDVRLHPAQYVRPYVKTNKSDAADVEAICEAVTRPTMRFVPIKEEMQQEALVLHSVRQMLIRQRTQLINTIRVHLTEFGIIGPNRAHNIGLLTKLIEDGEFDELPPVARQALRYLAEQLSEVKAKLLRIGRDLSGMVKRSEACQRLMTIPGVGVVSATALVSSMREPSDFKSGRHFAAWLGLGPSQHSPGGKDKLGGISKRGYGNLRTLLIHGRRSVMRWRSHSWSWLEKLLDRRPPNVAAVAIANKTARVIWALLRFGGTFGHPGEGAKMTNA